MMNMNGHSEANVQVAALNIPPKGLFEAETPFHWYKEMRENGPVRFDPERNCWDVFLYDDVKAILANHEAFSSTNIPGLSGSSILSMDPPKHKLYRAIVSKAFTPKAVEDLAPRIQELTDELLDEIEAQGEMDAIASLSFPLPVIIIAELLGVPRSGRDQFKLWSDEAIRGIDVEHGETREQYAENKIKNRLALSEYFKEIIEEKRKNPGNDLVSALLAAKVEEQSLNLPELMEFCRLLLIAGNETTTNLIGNAIVCFAEHPDSQKQIREDLSLLPNAIEEVLRYRSPIQSITRRCSKNTKIAGQTIRAEDTVVLWSGSANHDDRQFEQANQFNIFRSPNPHIAFGNGIHFCLGAPLSRLEARIALTQVFTRFSAFTAKEGVSFTPAKDPLIYGYKSIPITFQK